MSARPFASAALARIPVLTVIAAVLPGLVNPRLTAAQGGPGRDLSVNISQVGNATATPTRTNMAFIVTVSNTRSGSASDVAVAISVPPGFTSPSASPGAGSGFTCTFTGNTASCTTPTVAGGTQKTVRIEATTPATISGTSQPFTLTAQVDPSKTVGEENEGNNSDNFTVNVVTRADLDVNLESPSGIAKTQVAPTLGYLVTVENNGDGEAANVLIRSTLPKDVTFVQAEDNQLGPCLANSTASNGAQNVSCTLSSLPAGARRHVRLVGRIVGSVLDSTQVTFASNVDPNNTVPERNETNNTAFVITTVRAPSEVQLTGTAIGQVPVTPGVVLGVGSRTGQPFVDLKLTVKNNGPYPSAATTVGIVWPGGFTAQAGSCFTSCDVPALAPGQSIVVEPQGNHRMQGTVQITVTLDPNGRTFDRIVGNNRITFTVAVP